MLDSVSPILRLICVDLVTSPDVIDSDANWLPPDPVYDSRILRPELLMRAKSRWGSPNGEMGGIIGYIAQFIDGSVARIMAED